MRLTLKDSHLFDTPTDSTEMIVPQLETVTRVSSTSYANQKLTIPVV